MRVVVGIHIENATDKLQRMWRVDRRLRNIKLEVGDICQVKVRGKLTKIQVVDVKEMSKEVVKALGIRSYIHSKVEE